MWGARHWMFRIGGHNNRRAKQAERLDLHLRRAQEVLAGPPELIPSPSRSTMRPATLALLWSR